MAATTLNAQGNHTLEMQGGWMWNLRSYANTPSMATGYMGDKVIGGGGMLRYTRFTTANWGIFVSGELASLNHEPHKVQQQHGPNQYHYQATPQDECQPVIIGNTTGPYYIQVLTGISYRYDFWSRWSLRARLGLGYRDMHPEVDYSYTRYDKSLTNPESMEQVTVRAVDSHHKPIHRAFSFAWSPSAQLCYTPLHHMFFTSEIQWTGTARQLYERISVYDVELKDTSYHKVKMGNFIALRLGIGWNFGLYNSKL